MLSGDIFKVRKVLGKGAHRCERKDASQSDRQWPGEEGQPKNS